MSPNWTVKKRKNTAMPATKTDSFIGYNGEQQTDSLATYRDWLQARGGVSIYV